MNAATIPASAARKVGLFMDAIKFHESIFALPFAYTGMILAAWTASEGVRWYPTLHQFIWITVAMVGARTVGMAANRIIDRYIDAQNPRNASRHLPSGSLTVRDMTLLTLDGSRNFHFCGVSVEHTCVSACAGCCSLSRLLPVHQAIHVDFKPAAWVGTGDRSFGGMDWRNGQPDVASGAAFTCGSTLGRQLRYPLSYSRFRFPEAGWIALGGQPIRCRWSILVGTGLGFTRTCYVNCSWPLAQSWLAILRWYFGVGGIPYLQTPSRFA